MRHTSEFVSGDENKTEVRLVETYTSEFYLRDEIRQINVRSIETYLVVSRFGLAVRR